METKNTQTTIEDLQGRGGYRFAKVIYILAFLFLSGMILLASAGFAFYKQYEGGIEEWRAQLPSGEVIEQFREENPELQNLNQEETFQEISENPEEYQELFSQMQNGNIDPERLQALGQSFEQFQGGDILNFGSILETGQQLLGDGSSLFSLETLRENGESRGFFWKTFATYAAVGLFILIIVFECIRRLAYYTLTGTFTPPKQNTHTQQPTTEMDA